MLVVVIALAVAANAAAANPKNAAPRAASTAQQTAQASSKPTVALVELKGLVEDNDRLAVDEKLRAMLPAFDVEVQKKPKTLQAQKDLNSLGLCTDAGSVECLVQVGALSKARIVLAGVLSPGDGAVSATLDLVGVDVNGMRERGRVKVVVPGADDVEGRSLALESALTGILRPEAWQGELKVDVAQRGASIYVDGAPRGFAPLSEPLELTPGAHAVFVSLEGFAVFKENVDVAFKKTATLDVTLIPGITEAPPKMAAIGNDKPAPAATTTAPADTTSTRKTPLRVVMYDVDAVGVEPRVARVLGDLLVAEIRKREHVSVLDATELRAIVGHGASTTNVDNKHCSAGECFAEVADALGADVVVVSNLTNVGGEILFGLRRVDPHKQEVAKSFLARVPANDTAALLPLVDKCVAQVFADVPLRAGERRGVDEKAALVLNPPPLSPLVTGSLYAGAAVAGAAMIGGIGTMIVTGTQYVARTHDDAVIAQRDGVVPADENRKIAPLATTFYVAEGTAFAGLAVGVLLGASAAIAGEFTDWDNDAAKGGPR